MITIDFASLEWQTFLGGNLYGPEGEDDTRWNWLGEKPCWCVLPELPVAKEYTLGLDAAPMAPFEGQLYELKLLHRNRKVLHRVLPASPDLRTSVSLSVPAPVRAPGSEAPVTLDVEWSVLQAPAITVSTSIREIARLEYSPEPRKHRREFRLGASDLGNDRALFLAPSISFDSATFGKVDENRVLSFRLFTLTIE